MGNEARKNMENEFGSVISQETLNLVNQLIHNPNFSTTDLLEKYKNELLEMCSRYKVSSNEELITKADTNEVSDEDAMKILDYTSFLSEQRDLAIKQ
jgi:septum formation topological specificity factor MinE